MIWNLLLAPVKALAMLPVQQINPDPCIVSGLGCGDPFAIVANLMTGSLLISIFGVVLFIMIIVYGVTLIVNSRNEGAQEEAVGSYVNAFIGTVLAASSSYIAGLVISGGATRNGTPVNTGAISGLVGILAEMYEFIKVLVIGLLILNLTVQAFRIITATDDSGASDARNGLVRSILGAVIVLIAVPVINSIVPGGPPAGIITQFANISVYLATIVGGLAAIGLVVAGIMYIVSIDEGLKERANKLIIVCLLTLIVAAVAFALLSSI